MFQNQMTKNPSLNIVGLDIGDKKIGVARANIIAKIPEALKTLKNDSSFNQNLKDLIHDQATNLVVVGLPRGGRGQETVQTKKVIEFIDQLKHDFAEVEFVFVDESLSSVRADEYLKGTKYKIDQDSVAACFILQEYFTINV